MIVELISYYEISLRIMNVCAILELGVGKRAKTEIIASALSYPVDRALFILVRNVSGGGVDGS